jgi:hypothetical protein
LGGPASGIDKLNLVSITDKQLIGSLELSSLTNNVVRYNALVVKSEIYRHSFGQLLRLLFAVFAITGFISCEQDQSKSPYPYLSFDNSDKQKFVNYSENAILKFDSKTAPSRTYQVERIVQTKREYTVGMGFFGTYAAKYFDYDELSISFKNQDGKINKWTINYSKRPTIYNGNGTEPDFSTVKLVSEMGMWEWNSSAIRLDDTSSLIPLTISNQQIDNVQKITSGKSFETKSTEANRYDWSINTIYFHSKLGVLGFRNVSGNEWLLSK